MIFSTRYKGADGNPLVVGDEMVKNVIAQTEGGLTVHSEAGPILSAVCNHLVRQRRPFKLEWTGYDWTLELVR